MFYQQVGSLLPHVSNLNEIWLCFLLAWEGRGKGEEKLVKMKKIIMIKKNPTMMLWCHFKTVVLMNNLKPTQEPIPGLAKLGSHPTTN